MSQAPAISRRLHLYVAAVAVLGPFCRASRRHNGRRGYCLEPSSRQLDALRPDRRCGPDRHSIDAPHAHQRDDRSHDSDALDGTDLVGARDRLWCDVDRGMSAFAARKGGPAGGTVRRRSNSHLRRCRCPSFLLATAPSSLDRGSLESSSGSPSPALRCIWSIPRLVATAGAVQTGVAPLHAWSVDLSLELRQHLGDDRFRRLRVDRRHICPDRPSCDPPSVLAAHYQAVTKSVELRTDTREGTGIAGRAIIELERSIYSRGRLARGLPRLVRSIAHDLGMTEEEADPHRVCRASPRPGQSCHRPGRARKVEADRFRVGTNALAPGLRCGRRRRIPRLR